MKLSKITTRLLIVTFIALSSLLLLGVFQTPPGSSKNLPTEFIEERLQGCKLDNNSKNETIGIGKHKKCLVELVIDSFEGGQLETFNYHLTNIAGKDQAGYIWCHPALHEAGARLYGKNIEFDILLNEGYNREGVCENGLIHGFFDAFGVANNFNLVKWQEYANGCSLFQGNVLITKLLKTVCGDGAGHAMWQGTHDFITSFKSCLALNDFNVLRGCVGGVMMQIPKDDSDGKKSLFSYQEIPNRWQEVCLAFHQSVKEFPKDTLKDPTGFIDSACGVMAGQNYSVYKASDILFPAKPLTDDTLSEIIGSAMEFCDSFKGLERLGCRTEYAFQGKFATGFDSVLQNRYCTKLPLELQKFCYSNFLSLINKYLCLKVSLRYI